MTELPVINGVPVVPGTALAAVVAITPPELLPLMPVPILTALSAAPATVLAASTVGGDVCEKALLSISATATAALALMGKAK